MADKILSVQTITVSSTQKEIAIPKLWKPGYTSWGNTSKDGAEFWNSDKVIYVFDQFSGSFELVQEETDTEGLTIYENSTTKQAQSGPWRLIAAPPRFLYNSGSNSQDIKVTVIKVR